MSQVQIVRVTGYYTDAGFIERIIANFRKLLIDVDAICGRRVNEEGLYEVYLVVRNHPNFYIAVLNLSKTPLIEKVEVFEYSRAFNHIDDMCTSSEKVFTFCIAKPLNIKEFAWGTIHG
jgi:hypothetical protein